MSYRMDVTFLCSWLEITIIIEKCPALLIGVDKDNRTVLFYAARIIGNIEVVKYLVEIALVDVFAADKVILLFTR